MFLFSVPEPLINPEITTTTIKPRLHLTASMLLLALCLMLSACVSPPFSSDGVARDVSPLDTLQEETIEVGQRIMWGGVVVSSNNNSEGSQLELLTYPLDYLQRPDANRRSTGRILINSTQYLETLDFATGKRVTAVGEFAGTATGKVGEAEHVFPIMNASDIHLWTADEYYNSVPVSIGIGISISN